MQRFSLCIDIDGTLTSEENENAYESKTYIGTVRRGVREVIAELYQTHYIHFMTAREESLVSACVSWLYRQQLPFDSLSLFSPATKEDRVRELEGDFVIEGSYEHALRLAGLGFQVLLLDSSGNQGPILPNITRVYNWYHVKAALLRSQEQEAS